VNVFLAVLWKDLLVEWRSRDRVVAMGVFALLVVLVFQFALPRQTPEETRALAPGLLWVIYLFAALLGLNRAFSLELENDALSGLALVPADRGWIFLGKAAANLALLTVVEIATAVVFAGVMGVDLGPVAVPGVGIAVLGALGLASVGTLFGAIAVRTRFREIMLPLLLVPLLLPVLVGAVQASAGLLAEGRPPPAAVRLLLAADGIYLIVSFLVFEYVLDE